jgi:thiamine-phosphate pyrophosphorylase
MPQNLAELLRLMAVTDDRAVAGRDLVALCRAAVRGGATAIQLRLKQATPRDLAAAVEAVRASLSEATPILVNDRLDVALACGASGVHLGEGDVPVARARRIAPPGFLLGASVGSRDEAAVAGDADYWGIGPWRVTGTKDDAGPALGPQGFRALVRLAGGRPCLAIGGVRPDDVPAVRAAGGAGVAVVSGIFGADDVGRAAEAYASRLRSEG